jgi:hypothetical protein
MLTLQPQVALKIPFNSSATVAWVLVERKSNKLQTCLLACLIGYGKGFISADGQPNRQLHSTLIDDAERTCGWHLEKARNGCCGRNKATSTLPKAFMGGGAVIHITICTTRKLLKYNSSEWPSLRTLIGELEWTCQKLYSRLVKPRQLLARNSQPFTHRWRHK